LGNLIPKNLVESPEEQRSDKMQRNTETQRGSPPPLSTRKLRDVHRQLQKEALMKVDKECLFLRKKTLFSLVATSCFCLAAREHIRHCTFQ